jgi:capsule polysaccharide export protein KpsE/RkpR
MQDLQSAVAKLNAELSVRSEGSDKQAVSTAQVEALCTEVSMLRKQVASQQGSLEAAEHSTGQLSSEVERLQGLLHQAEKQQAELRLFFEQTAHGMLQRVSGNASSAARKGRARHQ